MSRAVFVIGFGGPETMDQVRPFLNDLHEGNFLPTGRLEESVRRYETMGGGSPHNQLTRNLADSLSLRFADRKDLFPVYVGFRCASPRVDEVLRRMVSDGVTEAVGIVLSSFRSESSWGRTLKAIDEARAAVPGAPTVRLLNPFSDDALFIHALLERVREGESSIPEKLRDVVPWVFTAASVPLSDNHSSHYTDQIRRAVQRLADEAGHADWILSFQSRGGRPEDPWLGPDVGEVVSSLSLTRSLDVLVIPAGYLVDDVEVLHDLDVTVRRTVENAGLTYHRAPTVGSHPLFLDLLSLRVLHAFDLSVGEVS